MNQYRLSRAILFAALFLQKTSLFSTQTTAPFIFTQESSEFHSNTPLHNQLKEIIFPTDQTQTIAAKKTYVKKQLQLFLDLLQQTTIEIPIKTANKKTNALVKKIPVSDSTKIKVHGDFHGNYGALADQIITSLQDGTIDTKSLKITNDTIFLVFGDYADRGKHGLEILLLLIHIQLQNPDRVFLLKGNHDDTKLSRTYGFAKELEEKLGITDEIKIITHLKKWQDCFNLLPEMIILDWSNTDGSHTYIPCVHAGVESETLAKQTKTINAYKNNCNQIKNLLQNKELSTTTLNLAYTPYFTEGNPYAWDKKDQRSSFRNPYTWFDLSENNATHTQQNKRGKTLRTLGALDIKKFLKNAFPENSSVPTILRAHQQQNRLLFANHQHPTIAKLLGGLAWTLDYIPENSKYANTWITIQKVTSENKFTAHIQHFIKNENIILSPVDNIASKHI